MLLASGRNAARNLGYLCLWYASYRPVRPLQLSEQRILRAYKSRNSASIFVPRRLASGPASTFIDLLKKNTCSSVACGVVQMCRSGSCIPFLNCFILAKWRLVTKTRLQNSPVSSILFDHRPTCSENILWFCRDAKNILWFCRDAKMTHVTVCFWLAVPALR
jgi:hypothetical protein